MSCEKEKISLGKRILALGRKNGLNSMNAILKESRLEYKQIGKLPKGEGNPTFETLYKLAKSLKVNINDLFK